MIATVLMEDTDPGNGLRYEHGFSVFVETGCTKLIVDSGASDATWENAKALGVDVGSAEMLFLSHGHYDHADGLPAFTGINPAATVYMHPNALLSYYNLGYGYDKYIGVDPAVRELRNISYIVEDTRISPEVSVFCHVTGRRKWPAGNLNLKVKQHDRLIQDSFDHELYTVVSENGKTVLISGCAHNGILNILDRFRAIYGRDPDAVISGFHTMKKSVYTKDEADLIADIAGELSRTDIRFYTGHCTGTPAYDIMKPIMGSKLEYVRAGTRISL